MLHGPAATPLLDVLSRCTLFRLMVVSIQCGCPQKKSLKIRVHIRSPDVWKLPVGCTPAAAPPYSAAAQTLF